ncbi:MULTISPECIES: TlpA family protein disulfide reductase [Burkholderia]|uniref:TlpA family protein disulfide reductase n=1 Tax=Burkholderia gladioli TaxID=28095 RepID=A0A2A7S879_BURGA|nr:MULTISPECIES: TlpA disulfide reductase family protein [Burkholderia]ATF85530.1 redoxin [Burkholderia gladioli pv. gladioli]MBJ9659544.1 TlpA family protein disulfide reductase [Burkholderia gladioli]MBJ9710210.1 TlpA family protein disulfide reductase [Burkholderia gladioli]MBU9154009.1 TlpA family protein disulfide reductase [Burkholderia gladioli]MBU9168735.1 TlpA family protein disulfide reductase [Burkholderia gladioli]
MNSKRLLPVAVVAAVAIAGGLAAGHWVRGDVFESSAQAATAKAADPVAALWAASVTDTEGKPQSLANFKGQKVVVNFWASWCGPCVQEMPELVQLSHEYKSRGIRFVGVAVDSDKNVQAFLQKVKVDYPVVVSGYAGADLARNFGNTAGALPFTVVIDANGRVRVTKLGQIQVGELKKTLDTL